MKRQQYSLLLVGALACIASLSSTAAPLDLTAAGITTMDSVTSSSTFEYEFFGPVSESSPSYGTGVYGASNLSTLTYATYVPSTTGAGSTTSYSDPSFAKIDFDGTTYQSGRYAYGGATSVEQTLGTITLNASTPSSFILGIYTDNFGSSLNGTDFSLTISDGVNSSTDSILWNGATVKNDFYNFSISGAQSGDTITINGTSTFQPEIGGIIFDVPSVPEPSTYALLGLGLIFLAVLRRRSMIKG